MPKFYQDERGNYGPQCRKHLAVYHWRCFVGTKGSFYNNLHLHQSESLEYDFKITFALFKLLSIESGDESLR